MALEVQLTSAFSNSLLLIDVTRRSFDSRKPGDDGVRCDAMQDGYWRTRKVCQIFESRSLHRIRFRFGSVVLVLHGWLAINGAGSVQYKYIQDMRFLWNTLYGIELFASKSISITHY